MLRMKTLKNKTILAIVATALVAGTAFFVSCSKEDSDENIQQTKSDIKKLLFSSECTKGDEKNIMHCIGFDYTQGQFKYNILSTTIKDGILVDDSKGTWIIDRDYLPFEVGDIVMNESDTGFYIYCQEEVVFVHDVKISKNSISFSAKSKNGEHIECKAYDIDESLSLSIPETKSIAIPANILRAALVAAGIASGVVVAISVTGLVLEIAIKLCNEKKQEGIERCRSLGCSWVSHNLCSVKCTGSRYCEEIANH